MDRGAWRATVHGAKESDMTEQLSTHMLAFTSGNTKKKQNMDKEWLLTES